MKDFHKLKVWERSHALTLNIYQHTKAFPKDELYGLTSQIRRSAASIPTNISEGCGRNAWGEFLQFFNIAIGSACELEYQLILSHDLHYLTDGAFNELSSQVIEVRQMLYAYSQTIRSDLSKKAQ